MNITMKMLNKFNDELVIAGFCEASFLQPERITWVLPNGRMSLTLHPPTTSKSGIESSRYKWVPSVRYVVLPEHFHDFDTWEGALVAVNYFMRELVDITTFHDITHNA